MDLIVWRHASVEPSLLPDLERELSVEGHQQAARTAQLLNPELPANCRILVSPAKRAQQTAQALKREYITVDALAPRSEMEEILAAANWPNNKETVLIVGHQPNLGLIVNKLTGIRQDVDLKNSHFYWISRREVDGQQKLYLKTFVCAEYIRNFD